MASVDPLGAIHPRLSGGAGVWGGSELSGAAEAAFQADVVGFIRNRGRNYTCCGYWKAYGDPEAAQKRFDQYRRCTAACCEQFRKGTAITQLIAA